MSRIGRLSIRTQLLGLIVLFAVSLSLSFGWFLLWAYGEAQAAAYAKVKLLSDSSVSYLSQVLRHNEVTLRRIAERPLVRALDPQHCDPFITEYIAQDTTLATFTVRDLQGNSVCSLTAKPFSAEQINRFAWFQAAVRSETFGVSEAYRRDASGRWAVAMTYPARDAKNRVSGVVILPLDLITLSTHAFDGVPPGAVVFVADQNQRVMMRSSDVESWIGRILSAGFQEKSRGNPAGFFSEAGSINVPRLFAFATVPGTGWRVFAGLPESEVFGEYRNKLAQSALFGAALLGVLLWAAWRLSRRIIQPIDALAAVSQKVAAGNLATRADLDGPQEIRTVAGQFNKMLDIRTATEEALRQSTLRYESVVSGAMDAIVAVDERHQIVLFNAAAEHVFGYSQAEVLGLSLNVLLPANMHALHTQHLDEVVANSLDAPRRMARARPLFGQRKDGTPFPIEASIASVQTARGMLMTAIVRDISERQQAEQALQALNQTLEQRVKARTLELEEANRDLEAFSYSVSHDLRSPLRAIGAYTSMLKEDLGEAVGAEKTKMMDRIVANTKKMAQLIDDVLAYGKTTRGPLHLVEINLDTEAAEIIDELQAHYPHTRFDIASLGTVRGDLPMVRQILSNLIENACKYSAQNPAARVAMGCVDSDGARRYFIRDNGIGFDMAHSANLFGMFRRLHSDPAIPGNGVGLAIVKRLIERHHGSIDAQSKPGEGALFTFTLG